MFALLFLESFFICNVGFCINEYLALGFLVSHLNFLSQYALDKVSMLVAKISNWWCLRSFRKLSPCKQVGGRRWQQKRRKKCTLKWQRAWKHLFCWYLVLCMAIEKSCKQISSSFRSAVKWWRRDNRIAVKSRPLQNYMWALASRVRNKLMHLANGNGKGRVRARPKQKPCQQLHLLQQT